jgi:curved DNA-binding protein CbpA
LTDDEFDAYAALQITPHAEEFVLEAAYRALARHFHPDGGTPDERRMAEINRAYDLLRTTERRKRYDRLHRIRPMGPGDGSPAGAGQGSAPFGSRVPPPTDGPAGLRGAAAAADNDPANPVLEFGRYEGWKLKDLAKHDPDYLRWLSRHSSGVRYRNLIIALVGIEGAPLRR